MFKPQFLKFLLINTLLIITSQTFAVNRQGRLGIGYANSLQNNLSTLSFKIQKNRRFAFGAVFNFSSDQTNGGMGAGIKLYKILFDEPNLNFYTSMLGALIKKTISGTSQSGVELDLLLGTEFNIPGISSIGFSFEFGASMYNLNKFVISTKSINVIQSGIHFYL